MKISDGAASWPLIFALAFLSILMGLGVVITGVYGIFIIALLIIVVMVFVKYQVGVWLLILFFPISSSYLFPHQLFGITGLNPFNIIISVTFLSYVIYRNFNSSTQKSGLVIERKLLSPSASPYRWLFWLLLVPVIVAGIHGAPNVSKIPAAFLMSDSELFQTPTAYLRDTVIKPLIFILFSILVGFAVRESKRPAIYLLPAGLSVFLLVGAMLVLVLMSGASIKWLSSAGAREFFAPLGRHANELGLMLNMAYAIALAAWYRVPTSLAKTGLLIMAGLASIGVALTFSRGAFLAFLIINLVFLISRKQLGVMLIGLVAAAIVALLLPGEFYERALTGITSGNVHNLSAGRATNIWPQLFPEFLHSPIFGNGLRSTLWAEAIIRGSAPLIGHPHSAYLALLTDMGLVGTFLIIAFYIRIWGGFRSVMQDVPSPILVGVLEGGALSVLVLAIQGITDDRFTPTPQQAYLWLAVGFLLGLWSEKQPTKQGSFSSKRPA